MAFTLMPPTKDRYLISRIKPFEASKNHKGYKIMPIFAEYEDAVDFKLNYLKEPEFKDYRVYEIEVNLKLI